MAFLTPDPSHLDRRDLPPGAGGPGDRRLVPDAEYRAWDGSQSVPDLTADELVDALADDVLEAGDVEEALRRLFQRGVRMDQPGRSDLAGLRDLMDRLRERRRELLAEGQLADPLAEVREELDEIVGKERTAIERRLDETEPGADAANANAGSDTADGGAEASAQPGEGGEPGEAAEGGGETGKAGERAPAGAPSGSGRTASRGGNPDAGVDPELRQMLRSIAARRRDSLDALPPDVGKRLRALQDYDFLDPDARQQFNDLVDRLRKTTLDRYTKGLSDAVKGLRPEDLAAQRQMVRDLNDLLEQRLAGREPSQDAVNDFLRQHGDFFPGAETLDDVVEQLAERMQAMQSLLRSLTPEQRAELRDTIDALLRDDRLKWDLARMAANLDQLLPGGLGERVPFGGDEPLGLESALQQLDQLGALDTLEGQLDGTTGAGDLGSIDRQQVRDLLGPDAARDLDALDDVVGRLERAGYLERQGNRLELTPRATRRIGQRVLDQLFSRLRRDAFGGHRLERAGQGGDREETAKPLEFGDPFHLDLRATLGNSLRREENAPGVRGSGPLHLRPEDFEVYRTEHSTSAATVLLLDMSRSMLLRGCYLAAKRVAIALDALIRSEFPRDHLAVVGFAYTARELRPQTLPALSFDGFEYGTNLQHALALARRILARTRAANREIIVITDGEPTAHFEGDRVEFSYPPTMRTINATLREVVRCTKDGITINTFMLDRTPALTDFVRYVTELNRGRAFYAEPEHLGEYVLVDFVQRRTTRIR